MRRIPELDGLRGVAILTVVWAHAFNGVKPENRRLFPGTDWLSGGGFAGVQLFFVLSGFLITGLLLREHSDVGAVDLKAFYIRRARRLLPALAVVLVFYGAFVLVARDGRAIGRGAGGIVRSALYIENFAASTTLIPTDGYLGHTWSLAVEEQFYLLWPLLLVGVVRWRRSALPAVMLAIILTTVVARYAMFGHVQIYGTMHWDALMMGCLLAVLPMRPNRVLGLLALAGIIGLTAWTWSIEHPNIFVLTAALGALAVAHATAVPWLGSSGLRYFGRISYGLYLWHVLLLRFGWHAVPTVALSIVVADLSYRLIESRYLRPANRPTHASATSAYQ